MFGRPTLEERINLIVSKTIHEEIRRIVGVTITNETRFSTADVRRECLKKFKELENRDDFIANIVTRINAMQVNP
jgi:hypothetical protein